jgi:tetratricopeptide (TPR) repeat protein
VIGLWIGVRIDVRMARADEPSEQPKIAAKIATPDIPKQLPDGFVCVPFENYSATAQIEWMRVGIPAALTEKLEADPALRAIDGPTIIPAGAAPKTIDDATIAAIAKKNGAKFVFSGGVERTKTWALGLTLRLWSVSDDGKATLVGESKQTGEFGKTFSVLDAAIFDLLAKANLTPPAEIATLVKRAPTGDFYAFTLWGRGLLALHGLGKAADLANAEKDLIKAVYIDPKFAEAHRLLAVVDEMKGDVGKARGQLSWSIELRPDYYAPLVAMVKIALDAREREDAIDYATRALALRPWDVETRFLLGQMLWEQGDEEGAELEEGRVVAFRPDHLAARRILVLVHASKGDDEKLAAELEAIIKLDPSDEAAKLDLGAAYHELGRDDDAMAVYEDIVKAKPNHLLALKFLGDLAKGRGDLKGAIEWYEKALAANRNDPRPYFLLGDAYLQAGEDQKALRIYLIAQKFPRYLGDAENNLGAIYYRRGNNDEALWYLKQAVVRRPWSAKVHYNFALALSKAHKRDLALAELQSAAELDPEDAEIRYAMGVVLLRLGKIEDAEKAFQEAVALAPQHEDALHNLRLIDALRRRATEGEIQVEGQQ